MRKNTDQKSSEFGHFLGSVKMEIEMKRIFLYFVYLIYLNQEF